jgi:hypothetical protein
MLVNGWSAKIDRVAFYGSNRTLSWYSILYGSGPYLWEFLVLWGVRAPRVKLHVFKRISTDPTQDSSRWWHDQRSLPMNQESEKMWQTWQARTLKYTWGFQTTAHPGGFYKAFEAMHVQACRDLRLSVGVNLPRLLEDVDVKVSQGLDSHTEGWSRAT